MRWCSWLVAIVALAFLAACDGMGSFGGWNPVDEDFSRLSPETTVDGALKRSCEDAEPLMRQDRVFEHALCLCGDLEQVGNGLVSHSSSYLMGTDPRQAHVGINGNIEVVGNFSVDGTLDVANGLQGVGNVEISRDLLSGSDVEITGSWTVGDDAWIDGDLQGVGSLAIGGDLFLSGDFDAVGSVDFAVGHRGFTYRDAPCQCGAGEVIDVAAEIAAHASENDNQQLPSGVGSSAVVLDSGAYYFASSSELVGSSSITVRGRVELYLAGNLDAVGDLNINLEEGAELELWLTGRVNTVGNLAFVSDGDMRPRAFKLYMGGQGSSVVNVGNALFVGSVYAPQVDIEYVGNLEVRGSLFANNLSGTGNLTLAYDTDVVAPDLCADQAYMNQNGE